MFEDQGLNEKYLNARTWADKERRRNLASGEHGHGVGFDNRVMVLEQRPDGTVNAHVSFNDIRAAGIVGIRNRLITSSAAGFTPNTRLFVGGNSVGTQGSGIQGQYPLLPDPLFDLGETEADRALNLLWSWTHSGATVNDPVFGVRPAGASTDWLRTSGHSFIPTIESLKNDSTYYVIWTLQCTIASSPNKSAADVLMCDYFGDNTVLSRNSGLGLRSEYIKSQQGLLYRLGGVNPNPSNTTPAPLIPASQGVIGAFTHGIVKLLKMSDPGSSTLNTGAGRIDIAAYNIVKGDLADEATFNAPTAAGKDPDDTALADAIDITPLTVPRIIFSNDAYINDLVRFYGAFLGTAASGGVEFMIDGGILQAADLSGGELTPYFFARLNPTTERKIQIRLQHARPGTPIARASNLNSSSTIFAQGIAGGTGTDVTQWRFQIRKDGVDAKGKPLPYGNFTGWSSTASYTFGGISDSTDIKASTKYLVRVQARGADNRYLQNPVSNISAPSAATTTA